jgi:hypothetical protein
MPLPLLPSGGIPPLISGANAPLNGSRRQRCSAGHQYVVRPPIVDLESGVPHRGHTPSR